MGVTLSPYRASQTMATSNSNISSEGEIPGARGEDEHCGGGQWSQSGWLPQDGRGLAGISGHCHEESQDRHLLPDEHRADWQSLPAGWVSLQHRALQQWSDYLPGRPSSHQWLWSDDRWYWSIGQYGGE